MAGCNQLRWAHSVPALLGDAGLLARVYGDGGLPAVPRLVLDSLIPSGLRLT